MAVCNKEMFEEFYRFCKNNTIEEVVKEYGGGTLYIPSYKSMYRDKELLADWRAGMGKRDLQRKYYLSDAQVRRIIASNRDDPSLFAEDEEE